MTIASIRTSSTDRFVMPSGDHPVELNHDLRVTELITDVPSVGMASAYMDVLIQEACSQNAPFPQQITAVNLMERIEFSEEREADALRVCLDRARYDQPGRRQYNISFSLNSRGGLPSP